MYITPFHYIITSSTTDDNWIILSEIFEAKQNSCGTISESTCFRVCGERAHLRVVYAFCAFEPTKKTIK